MQYIIYILFLLTSVVGLAEIIHFAHLFFMTKKGKNNKVIICYLGVDKPELKLRYIAEQYRWHGGHYADKILAVYDSSDNSSFDKCVNIAKKNNILLIRFDEIENNINLEN